MIHLKHECFAFSQENTTYGVLSHISCFLVDHVLVKKTSDAFLF